MLTEPMQHLQLTSESRFFDDRLNNLLACDIQNYLGCYPHLHHERRKVRQTPSVYPAYNTQPLSFPDIRILGQAATSKYAIDVVISSASTLMVQPHIRGT
jgi:hypothetical protein